MESFASKIELRKSSKSFSIFLCLLLTVCFSRPSYGIVGFASNAVMGLSAEMWYGFDDC